MTFNKKLLAATLVTAGSFAAISSANAAGTTPASDFNVIMTVESVCSVDATPAAINFGPQNAGTLAADVGTAGVATSTGTINVLCSLNAPYIVNLTPQNLGGGGGTASLGMGTMKGPGTDIIDYQLYSKSTAVTGEEWGNTGTLAALNNGVSGTGGGLSGAPTTHLVYARLTSTTDVQLGDYSDTVSALVTY